MSKKENFVLYPPRQKMSSCIGFTLIELLVVVLIIGILASIALPQYKKAVEKSRATQAIALLRSVYEAEKIYYMANGSYTTDFDSLSVNIPWTGRVNWYGSNVSAALQRNVVPYTQCGQCRNGCNYRTVNRTVCRHRVFYVLRPAR